MKSTMVLIAVTATCLLGACGDAAEDNRGRVVEQDRLHSPIAPVEAVDDSVNTEAVVAMGMIHRQVKLKVAMTQDKAAFYRSISGTIGAGQLQALGISASELTGTWYKPSDYRIAINGRTMTITAGKPGTRGYVAPQEFAIP